MDNCSHNGDKVKSAVLAYASKWAEQGLVPAEFLAYVQDETKITFPWSMIDKITPRPDAKVQKMLADDGFEDNYTIVTEKHTFTAPFVNAEASRITTPMAVLRWSWAVCCTATARPWTRSRR